jgi:hypothetical protein
MSNSVVAAIEEPTAPRIVKSKTGSPKEAAKGTSTGALFYAERRTWTGL